MNRTKCQSSVPDRLVWVLPGCGSRTMSRRLGRLLRNSLTSTTTLVHCVLGGFFMRAR